MNCLRKRKFIGLDFASSVRRLLQIKGKLMILQYLVGQTVEIFRNRDAYTVRGEVVGVKSPKLEIRFSGENRLTVGDKVELACGDGVDYLRATLTVTSLSTESLEAWVTVEFLVPGVERARRVVAPGLVAEVVREDGVLFTASVCDVSESGLRLSSLDRLGAGESPVVRLSANGGWLELRCRVARVAQALGSDYVEMGLQILEADRLSRARWNHLVTTLLKKYGSAA